jgi:ribosomal protein L10
MIPKKNKEWKKKKFEELKQMKVKYNSFIFFNFTELDIPAITEVRDKMKEIGNEVKISKNAFIEKIMGVKFEDPTAVVGVKDDPIKTIKILSKLIEKKIKGALIENKFLEREETIKLKNLPDAPELRGMVISLLISAIYRLITSLSWYPSSLISILKQKSEKE